MLSIRKVLWSLVLVLILINSSLWCWHRGFEVGYCTAMSDVVLEIETPEIFFTKMFDITPPSKVQLNQEQK
jgi:hypothetical protein